MIRIQIQICIYKICAHILNHLKFVWDFLGTKTIHHCEIHGLCAALVSFLKKWWFPWSGSQDSLKGTTNSALAFHMFITFHNSFSGRVAGRVVRARRVWTKTSPSWRPRRPNGRTSLKRWSAWALECRGTRELPGGFPKLIHEIILHKRVPWPSLVPKGLVLVDTSECWMMASQSFWENGLLRGYSGILLKYLPVVKHGNVKSQFTSGNIINGTFPYISIASKRWWG